MLNELRSRLPLPRLRRRSRVGVFLGNEHVALAAVSADGHQLLACDFREARRDNQPVALRDLVEQYGLRGSDAVVVLDSGDYQTQQVDAPRVPDEELAGAIRFQLKNLLYIPLEQARVAAHRQHSDRWNQEGHRALATVASRNRIDGVQELTARAGLKLRAVLPRETVLHDLSAEANEGAAGVAVAALGRDDGLITISRGELLYLARSHPVGTRRLMEDQQAVELLEDELRRSIDYFDGQLSTGPAGRILLAPCEADREVLVDRLNESFEIPCARLRLSQIFDVDGLGQELDEHTEAHCLFAAGAALPRPAEHALSMYVRERQQFEPLSPAALGGYMAAGVLLLGAVSAVHTPQVYERERRAADLEAERDELTATVARLERELEALEVDASLLAEREALERELALLEQFDRRLDALDRRALAGFSEPLRGLSRQRQDGLWLTSIRLRSGGGAFEGRAVTAQDVPGFLDGLAREPAFQGWHFEEFRMQRAAGVEDAADSVRFRVASPGLAGGDDGEE